MNTLKLSFALFAMYAIADIAIASPNPFGSNKSECQDYATEKYKADLEYIQQELFDNATLKQSIKDVHNIEMRACETMLYWG